MPFDDQAITFMTMDRLLPCPALETRRLLLPVKKALPHRVLAGCDRLHPAPRTTALLDVRVPAMVLSEVGQCDRRMGGGRSGWAVARQLLLREEPRLVSLLRLEPNSQFPLHADCALEVN